MVADMFESKSGSIAIRVTAHVVPASTKSVLAQQCSQRHRYGDHGGNRRGSRPRGEKVEKALQKLHAAPEPERDPYLKAAAQAVHAYFIQRELCGLRNHDDPIRHYGIPRSVLARLGVS